ncbi:hypothetical protein [Neorhizobium alkalisoli]|uniref:Uncharacterized protein n=1 Tax=Neorhizobium alkalisoli TaxID=528178 RepID=A0A561Q7U7_9HYPH|nr:hypothetical protein [Neorhizobium alkalisoli]TWF46419.1 hypothetical protein FHW37_115116 [Neorhizobium alkalisoli]
MLRIASNANRIQSLYSELCILQDYAVRSGIEIPEEMILEIQSVEASQENISAILLLLMKLTQLTKPVTVLNAPVASRMQEDSARQHLWWCGLFFSA